MTRQTTTWSGCGPLGARWLCGLLVLAWALLLLAPAPARAQENDMFSELRRYLVGNDRMRENPRAIDEPEFIPVTDASLYMDPECIVLVEEPETEGGTAYVFPRDVLTHLEVVNMKDNGGAKRSVTYSPLTGSVVGYKGSVRLHDTGLGTTGQFLNMNRVLYDRATNSLWPQILGRCISGPLRGEALERFPLLWTRWKYAAATYPGARVLSRPRGRRIVYDRDPYGSYRRPGTWYDTGGPKGPVTFRDDRLGPKERLLGYTDGEAAVAFVEQAVKLHRVASATVGLTPVAAMYDPEMDAVRVYHAEADGRTLTFETVGGEIIDQQTRSRWNARAEAVEGRLRGLRLERAAAMDCMWFAWVAFYPGTLVWTGPDSLAGF